MNYKKHYYKLIERAKNRTLNQYGEWHHIIPKCVGGKDSSDNLVKLSPREHFIAHLLLIKIYNNNYRLVKAFAMMCVGHGNKRKNNKLYSVFRNKLQEAQKLAQKGKRNSQYGTFWINNPAEKINKKISKSQTIPDGWQKGRVLVFKEVIKVKKHNTDNSKLIAKLHYENYKKLGYKSIRKYCLDGHYSKSYVSLTKMWKRYIVEYNNATAKGFGFIPR